MTWGARFKLVTGILGVLLVVAALTVVFNQRQTQVLSTSAQIEAERYDVGTDYGGVVLERYVDNGDTVHEGEPLFAVESVSLQRDIAQELVAASSTLAADGTVVVRASVDGVVSDLTTDAGGYAGAGTVVAAIDRAGTRYATAEFILSAKDFARVEDAASVDLRLPDGRMLVGTVADLTVTTVDGDAHVVARVDSEALAAGDADALMQPGTPVEATLHLRDDGPLAGVTSALADLARKVGL